MDPKKHTTRSHPQTPTTLISNIKILLKRITSTKKSSCLSRTPSKILSYNVQKEKEVWSCQNIGKYVRKEKVIGYILES